jgi:hypothetical protein
MKYKIRVFITDGIAYLPSNIGELFKSTELYFDKCDAEALLDGYGVDTTINVAIVA